jgi:crotonobetainyl-CoA:carnitine CoA-transferase CaiB-like acyl-CoA transferase
VTLPANPLRFAGLPPMPLRPSPDLGQDNAQLGVRMPDRRG